MTEWKETPTINHHGEISDERDRLKAENDRLRRCLGFFVSVIKSGEPWTETCDREYRVALTRIDQLLGEKSDD